MKIEILERQTYNRLSKILKFINVFESINDKRFSDNYNFLFEILFVYRFVAVVNIQNCKIQ